MDIMAKCIMTWFEAVGRARAANELFRMGMHKEAKKLMTEKWQIRATIYRSSSSNYYYNFR